MTALLVGMARRNVAELRRYAFDTVFQLAGLFMLLLLLLWGARAVGGPAVANGDALSSIVVGFVVFTVVILSYSNIANWMTQEATLGTLEQLAMSPYGLLRVLLAEYTAGIVSEAVFVAAFLLLGESVTGRSVHVDAVTLAPLVVLLLLQVLAIGLVLSGLAMVFKRVVSLTNLIQFAFIAAVAAPVESHPWLRFAPICLTNAMIRDATVTGRTLGAMPRADLVFVAALSAVYLAVSVVAFLRLEAVARERGVIGVH